MEERMNTELVTSSDLNLEKSEGELGKTSRLKYHRNWVVNDDRQCEKNKCNLGWKNWQAKAPRHDSIFIWQNISAIFTRIWFFSLQGYERSFIHKIKHKHILAKNYFSQIPVLASFILDDPEIDEIRWKHHSDTTPKIIESQRPPP